MSIKSHLPYQEPGESQLEWEKRQQTPKLRWHRLLELSDDDLKAAIIKNVRTKKKNVWNTNYKYTWRKRWDNLSK